MPVTEFTPLENRNQQIESTLIMMKRWQAFDPVIAGGAIWAWAAGIPARDVDIWMHSKHELKSTRGGEYADYLGGPP